jgi:hypothetical protein
VLNADITNTIFRDLLVYASFSSSAFDSTKTNCQCGGCDEEF